jgi:serine/threonine-protein kinase
MTIEDGQVLDGKYRISRLIGQGGMGAVYAGEHLRIGRRVAVKVLHANIANDAEIVTRFEREAQAAARIGNDHILDVLDVGSLPDGSRFMVCEFLDGETLSSRLEREKRLSPAQMVPIARQLLNGLGAAHLAGVVHRDLKPDNIFLLRHKAGWSDFVKIIDFGISKFQPLNADEGMRMTATGIVMGTPFYLSPEQARGTRDADGRSDIYAVGVILYESVTGQLPFAAQNFNELLFKIVLESPRPPHEVMPELDLAFSQIIMKAMARNPEDRFKDTTEMMTAIEQWAATSGLALAGPIVTGSGAARLPSNPNIVVPAPTPSNWGATGAMTAPEVKPARRTPAIAAAAAGAMLLVGGLAYGGYALTRSDDATPVGSAAVDSAAAPVAPKVEAPVPVTPKAPEPAPVQPAQPKPPAAATQAPPPDEPPVSANKPDRKPVNRPRATAASRPPPPPAPARTAAPAAPAKPGRRDFGY